MVQNQEAAAAERLSLPTEDERQMLRDNTRGCLERHWTKKQARAAEGSEIKALWRGLAGQGLAALLRIGLRGVISK
jgi:hypothetical protein